MKEKLADVSGSFRPCLHLQYLNAVPGKYNCQRRIHTNDIIIKKINDAQMKPKKKPKTEKYLFEIIIFFY